jgi:hypothetical protein
MILCDNSIDMSNGIDIKLICIKTNLPCAYYRWCTNESCIKMLVNYVECKNLENSSTQQL